MQSEEAISGWGKPFTLNSLTLEWMCWVSFPNPGGKQDEQFNNLVQQLKNVEHSQKNTLDQVKQVVNYLNFDRKL